MKEHPISRSKIKTLPTDVSDFFFLEKYQTENVVEDVPTGASQGARSLSFVHDRKKEIICYNEMLQTQVVHVILANAK